MDSSDIPRSKQRIIDIPRSEQPLLLAPPIRIYPHDSREIGKQDLQDFAAKHGYALVTLRSDEWKTDYACSLWPNPKPRELARDGTNPPVGGGTKPRKTREQNKIGTNCQFRVQLVRRKPRGSSASDETWVVRIQHGEHNHGPTPKHLLVILRQRERKEKEERLLAYFAKGLKSIQIWLVLQSKKSLLCLKDLQYLRARARLIFLDGRTPMEAVIKSLPDWFVYY